MGGDGFDIHNNLPYKSEDKHKLETFFRLGIEHCKDKTNLQSSDPMIPACDDDKDDLEAYFFSILSDYDEDRVYASDIKKILSWYNLLNQHKLIDFKTETSVSEEEE